MDCPAVRWRDANGDEEDGLEEKLYYLQDFRGDVTALVEPGTGIVEHVRYGPTGRPEAFPAADVNFDGKVDAQDQADYNAAYNAWKLDPDDYDPRADLNRDGELGGADNSIFNESYAQFAGLSGNWKLSQGAGLLPAKTQAEGYDNRFGWRGYWYDKRLQEYHVRHRVYDPRQGQWLQTDPIGFAAGDQNLYRYADGQYSMGYDPLGLDFKLTFTDFITPGAVLWKAVDEISGGGLTELVDVISGKAEAEDGRWQENIAKTTGYCWKTARDLRERGETQKAEETECLCRDMALQNAQDVANVQGIRQHEQERIEQTGRDIAITIATAGLGAGLRAVAELSRLGYYAYAGYNMYLVGSGSYQAGVGINMMINGQIGAGSLQVLGGGLTAAGGFGGAASAARARQLRFAFADAEETVFLYQKLSSQERHLKFGISENPAGRYSVSEMAGGRLRILASGTKEEMLGLERNLHRTLPLGIEEGKQYLQYQINRGYLPRDLYPHEP